MHVCPRCGFSDAVKVPEAAARLGVSGQTVRNWIKSGKLTGVETEPVQGSGYQYWIPLSVLKSSKVQALAETSRAAGALAKAGRAAAQ